ncbi:hypothetical protein [Pseudomonas boanensis]|uniref:hypothetical protein n=1 Tax=Metapseudomonas boanensis TaxID=2822138 RepID=UPI0035D4A5DF
MDQGRLHRVQPVVGDVLIAHRHCQEMGRSANVARLSVGLPQDQDPIPPLIDAQLLWMAPGGFVISGVELVDGVAYAQSWWCRSE